jgi:hypothetical protein
MLLVDGARAFIHGSSFRDLQLDLEMFDVSFGSAVRLQNCTFTNVTVPDNEYVSTSLNDWEYFKLRTLEVTYYPEDDAGPSFDLQRHRENDSSIPETGMYSYQSGTRQHGYINRALNLIFLNHCSNQGLKHGAGVDTRIEGVQTMSDCLFRWSDLPGCPEPLTGFLKDLYNRRAAFAQACYHMCHAINLDNPQPALCSPHKQLCSAVGTHG